MGTSVKRQGKLGGIVEFKTLVIGDAFYNLGYPETVLLKTTGNDHGEGKNAIYHPFNSVGHWCTTTLHSDQKVITLDAELVVKISPERREE